MSAAPLPRLVLVGVGTYVCGAFVQRLRVTDLGRRPSRLKLSARNQSLADATRKQYS